VDHRWLSGRTPQNIVCFYSPFILTGNTDPNGSMRAWIEESKQMAIDAIPGTSLNDYEYFEVNLSVNNCSFAKGWR